MALIRIQADPSYRVHRGEPELIGFPFLDDQEQKIGEIGDLIVDTTLMKIPFVIVFVEKGDRAGQKVIVPLRDVTLDATRQRAVCHRCHATTMSEYLVDDGGPIPVELEARVRAMFLPQVESHNILPEGHEGVEIAEDARTLTEFRPTQFVEKVDTVRIYDAQGHSHEEHPNRVDRP